jgi:hypothetical protein
MWFFSQERHLKPHGTFLNPNYHFYHTDRFPGTKGGTAVTVRKGIPHSHVDLLSVVSIETTGVCIEIGNSEMLVVGDLNAKHPFWNNVISNPSGENLFHINRFEISAQYPTHHSPTGNGDVLHTVVHNNALLSEVIASHILDSYHLPIFFHLLGHVRTRNLSDPVGKFTDWEWFQSLACDLIPPKIKINSGAEAVKAAAQYKLGYI